MSKSSEDFDLPEGTLAVGLVLKGTDFLNGHFSYCQTVKSRAGGIICQQSMTVSSREDISYTQYALGQIYLIHSML